MAKIIEATDPHAAWTTMDIKKVLNVFVYGLIIGVVTYALFLLLERFVFEPVLCRDSAALARCESREDFASGVAIILASMGGLTLLVRERVYRPILAIIGVAIALWNIFSLVAALPLLLSIATVAILFGLAYLLFSWLVQPISLLVSVAGVATVALLARLIAQ